MVAQRSPTPLVWVQILAPLPNNYSFIQSSILIVIKQFLYPYTELIYMGSFFCILKESELTLSYFYLPIANQLKRNSIFARFRSAILTTHNLKAERVASVHVVHTHALVVQRELI